MHLIATPFPWQWHSPDDTIANVNWNAAIDVARVVNTFVMEMLGLGKPGSYCSFCSTTGTSTADEL